MISTWNSRYDRRMRQRERSVSLSYSRGSQTAGWIRAKRRPPHKRPFVRGAAPAADERGKDSSAPERPRSKRKSATCARNYLRHLLAREVLRKF